MSLRPARRVMLEIRALIQVREPRRARRVRVGERAVEPRRTTETADLRRPHLSHDHGAGAKAGKCWR